MKTTLEEKLKPGMAGFLSEDEFREFICLLKATVGKPSVEAAPMLYGGRTVPSLILRFNQEPAPAWWGCGEEVEWRYDLMLLDGYALFRFTIYPPKGYRGKTWMRWVVLDPKLATLLAAPPRVVFIAVGRGQKNHIAIPINPEGIETLTLWMLINSLIPFPKRHPELDKIAVW